VALVDNIDGVSALAKEEKKIDLHAAFLSDDLTQRHLAKT
jgi:hypothetical protein